MEEKTGFEYKFDPEKHVRRRITSNHENRLPRAKKQKTKSRKKTRPSARKNRPYPNVQNMTLQCCTEGTCLLNHGHRVIATIRRDFDRKLYDEQNSFLVSLIDIKLRTQRNKITYHVRGATGLDKVKVCKTAFLKIFGIGRKRIQVLLKKDSAVLWSCFRRPKKKQQKPEKSPVNNKSRGIKSNILGVSRIQTNFATIFDSLSFLNHYHNLRIRRAQN